MTEESAGAVGVAQSSASWLSARSLLLVAAVVLALPLVLPIWTVGALVLGVPAAIWLATPKGASAAAPVEEQAQPHGVPVQDAEPTALADQVEAAFDKLTPRRLAPQGNAVKPAPMGQGSSPSANATANLVPAKPQPPQSLSTAQDSGPAAAPAAAPATATAAAAAAATPPAAAPAAGPALTGSAALLAQIRASRAAKPAAAAATNTGTDPQGKVTIVYGSQTGTAQEIARNVHAECTSRGLPAELYSLSELGWGSVNAERTPVLVVVTSSTGDGDPPDNSAAAWVQMKRPNAPDALKGVQFTLLGLGDSNYTRYMHVPRVWKSRLLELGATCFYPCAEADEVDGIETNVDPWTDGLWSHLQHVVKLAGRQEHLRTVVAATVIKQHSMQQHKQRNNGVHTPSNLAAEPTAALLATVTMSEEADPASNGAPRIGLELEESQGSEIASSVVSDSSYARISGGGAAGLMETGLVDGIAPVDVDLRGVPALAPCRVIVQMGLAAAEAKLAREREAAAPSAKELAARDPAGLYSPEQPFWATVSDAKLLTSRSSDRKVLHIELDLTGSGMSYSPGDAVGVVPQNDPKLVDELIHYLGLKWDEVFTVEHAGTSGGDQQQAPAPLPHLGCPCTVRTALMRGTDLTAPPRKSLLRMLAEHCSNADEKRTLLFMTARAGRGAYAQEIAAGQPSLLDLLKRFPSCKPPLAELLDALPPLMPRMYSATSAPCDHPNKLQFAFSVVRYTTAHGERRGVATNWLESLVAPLLKASKPLQPASPTKKGSPQKGPKAAAAAAAGGAAGALVRLPVFLRPSKDFRPPASPATPVVMVGPGTGVAPFRGFLEQRRSQLKTFTGTPGEAVLYFGCRRREEDYIYGEELEAFAAEGTLSQLRVAFSRAQEAKQYVQHLMAQDATKLARIIKSGGSVYVCGDGATMVKDVHAALATALQTSGMLKAEAEAALTAMAKAGRYVKDVWS